MESSALYVFMPLVLLKALNEFFHLGIPYNMETYCLSEILILVFGNPNFSFSDRREGSTKSKKSLAGAGSSDFFQFRQIVVFWRGESKGKVFLLFA